MYWKGMPCINELTHGTSVLSADPQGLDGLALAAAAATESDGGHGVDVVVVDVGGEVGGRLRWGSVDYRHLQYR